jgi:hypothetical protein
LRASDASRVLIQGHDIIDDDHFASRQRRRAAERATRKRPGQRLDRAELIRMLAELIDNDSSISGITLIEPTGDIDYIDADLLRRGGGRA